MTPFEIKFADNDLGGKFFQKPISFLKHAYAFTYKTIPWMACAL